MTETEPLDEPSTECQTASTPAFLGPRKIPGLLGTLIALARQFGHSITTEECRAVCMPLLIEMGYGSSATLYLDGKSSFGTSQTSALVKLLRDRLRARTPSAGPRTISLPLGRRKGGEILLTEELVQLAKSPARSEAPSSRPQEESEGQAFDKVQVQNALDYLTKKHQAALWNLDKATQTYMKGPAGMWPEHPLKTKAKA